MQMQVSKKNVFMRIAKFGFFSDMKYPPDICSLTRRVIASIVIHSIAGLIALGILSCLLSGLYGWYLFVNGHKVPEFFAVFSAIDLIITLGVGLGFGITKLVEYLKRKSREYEKKHPKVHVPEKPRKPKEPALIPLMYRSWKNKFCIKFELVDQ